MRFFEVLLPVAILGTFGATLYFFTKVLTDYILKKKMIEKGYVNDESQSVLKRHTAEDKLTSLKWGILILFAGIGLVIIDVLGVDPETTLPYGIFAITLSVGFLIYYTIVRRESK
jgi:hypothetical protein